MMVRNCDVVIIADGELEDGTNTDDVNNPMTDSVRARNEGEQPRTESSSMGMNRNN